LRKEQNKIFLNMKKFGLETISLITNGNQFRTKKNRSLEFKSAPKELPKGDYKVAVKVVDIFGNDTTKVIEVKI
jgi:hypothetical protein